MFESVLIANRGEIAIRVIRAAKELGMRTIAVYSEIDRDSLHVELADEAWNVGPAPSAESYLDIDRLLEVAAESGAVAIHPGYGFLAENAEFAARVIDAGAVWVGPPPDAIAVMGDKIRSRRAADEAGVPSVPGTLEPLTSVAEAEELAAKFGYPIALKAAHGGGGRGLKVARSAEDLPGAFESAQREADTYFKSPEVYVEKYLDKPRHIEAQILFDRHGAGVFLGERDCSVQRRHQKLIEEAPATVFSAEQRDAFGKAAVAIGEAAAYEGVGTVEFLVDRESAFYFLEMNTRLQVEHPVTELVTGVDLVHEQFRVASGEPLAITETPPFFGHAIEFRVNAEDPARNFLPEAGRIVDYRPPGGFGVRVDGWVRPGTAVSQYYDNLLAKLIVWGRDRDEAIHRGRRALEEFVVTGIPTTIPAHLRILTVESFVKGTHHTRTVEDELDFSDVTHDAGAALPEREELEERKLTVEIGGRNYQVRVWAPEATPRTDRRAGPRRRPPRLVRQQGAAGEDAGVLVAPMQGTIVKINKSAGERVRQGETICVLEAMKMENELKSAIDGEIVDLRIQSGDTVTTGQVVAVVR